MNISIGHLLDEALLLPIAERSAVVVACCCCTLGTEAKKRLNAL
jgi:hypothetical protein